MQKITLSEISTNQSHLILFDGQRICATHGSQRKGKCHELLIIKDFVLKTFWLHELALKT